MFNSALWAKLHGGATHFPIGLFLASVVFDLAGFIWNKDPIKRDLHVAAFYALLLGALGSLAAVLSGLLLTNWHLWGAGTLLKHHTFVWPAFGLLIGLAVWRVTVRERASRRAFALYFAIAVIGAVMMAIAGYWGGELWMGN